MPIYIYDDVEYDLDVADPKEAAGIIQKYLKKSSQGIGERFREAAVEATATGTLARGIAEAPKNRANALLEAITTAKERGNKAGYYPFNRPISELEAEYEELNKAANLRLDAYKMTREDIAKNMQKSTGNAALDFGIDIAGGIGAGLADPANLAPIPGAGLGTTVARSAARAFPGSAFAGAFQDLIGQEQDIRLGIQNNGLNYGQAALSGVIGGAVGSGMNAAAHAGRNIIQGRPATTPEPVLQNNIQIDPVIQRAQEIAASQGRAMTPADIEAAQAVPRMPTVQEPLDFNQGPPRYTPEELLRMRQEAAQGELISARESELFGQSREAGTTPDMFQGTGFSKYDTDLQAQQLEAARQRTLSQPESVPFDPYAGRLPDQPSGIPPRGGLDIPSNLAIDNTPPVTPQQGLGFETPEQAALRMRASQLETTVPPTLGEGLSLAQNNAVSSPIEASSRRLDLDPYTSLPGKPEKGFGGASEQSNMGADLFRPGEDMSARGTPPLNYQAIPKEDLNAGQIPGFLRTAEQLMAAKRLEKAGEPTTLQGQQIDPAEIRATERAVRQTRLDELTSKGKLTKKEAAEKKELLAYLKENPSLSTLPANHPSAKLKERIAANDFRGALEVVADLKYGELRGIPPQAVYFFKFLAKTMLRDENFTVPIKVVDYITPEMVDRAQSEVGGIIRGMFYKGEMTLASKAGGDASIGVFMHEAVHAKVKGYMTAYEFGLEIKGPRAAEIKKHLENLNNLFRHVKPRIEAMMAAEGKPNPYGIEDVHEFMAEVTNSEFLDVLSKVTIQPTMLNKLGAIYRNAYDAVVGIYNGILGIKGAKEKNAMNALLSETTKLLNAIDANTNGLLGQINKEGSTRDALQWDLVRTSDIKAAMSRKASEVTPQSKADFLKELRYKQTPAQIGAYGDALYNSYVEQWKKDNLPIKNPIGYDNTPTEDLMNRLFRANGDPRLDDLAAYGPAYSAANQHPLINKFYSQISQAEAKRDKIFQQLWRGAEVKDTGKKFVTVLSTVKRVESADSPAALKNKLKAPDKLEFIKHLIDAQRNDPGAFLEEAFMRAKGLPDSVVSLITSINKSNEAGFAEMNAAYKILGLPPIPYIKGWFVSRVRFGDFQVWEIDSKTGKHDFLQGFSSLGEAEKASKYLNETKGMNTVAAPAANNPRHLDTLPSDAYMQAMSLIDPAKRPEFRAVVQQASNAMGMSAHRLNRDSTAGGYPGSQEALDILGAEKAFDDVMNAVEAWYRQVANYAGAAEARAQLQPILQGTPSADGSIVNRVKDYYPNAYAYSKFMWEQFTGADRATDQLARGLSMWIATRTGMGDSSLVGNALVNSAKLFTAAQLTMLNPGFYLANAMQFVIMPPRLTQAAAKAGFSGDMDVAIGNTMVHMYRPGTLSKQLMHEFLDAGTIEPKFAEALDWAATAESKMINSVQYAMGVKVAAYADSWARANAAFMSYEFARSGGISHAEALSFAKREAGGAMIQYGKWARMPLINKLGTAGDAVAPLTSYITQTAALLASFIKDATTMERKKLIKPLMMILGANVAMAGIRGLPGHEDLEDIYLKLNSVLTSKGYESLPTTQEMYLQYLPDYLEYGIPSSIGVNLSGTLGLGRIVGNLGEAAGVEYAYKTITSLFNLAKDIGSYGVGVATAIPEGKEAVKAALSERLGPNTTDYSRYAAAAGVMPSVMREWLRGYLMDEDITTPARVLGRDNLPTEIRSPKEQALAMATGRVPLKEDRTKRAKHTFDTLREAKNDARSEAVTLLAQSLYRGYPTPPMVERYFRNYPEEVQSVREAANDKLKDFEKTYEERQYEKYRENPRMRDLLERTYSNVR